MIKVKSGKEIFLYETKSLKNLKYGKIKEMKKKNSTGVLISKSEQTSLLTTLKALANLTNEIPNTGIVNLKKSILFTNLSKKFDIMQHKGNIGIHNFHSNSLIKW